MSSSFKLIFVIFIAGGFLIYVFISHEISPENIERRKRMERIYDKSRAWYRGRMDADKYPNYDLDVPRSKTRAGSEFNSSIFRK